jgi:hypothetical protein
MKLVNAYGQVGKEETQGNVVVAVGTEIDG